MHFKLPCWLVALACCLTNTASLVAQSTEKRPNILWFIVDDMSANFSCYGEQTIRTPHVDQLAAEVTRFSHAFVTAPVCSPCRSALITGMYQTTIGAHHHRSGRGQLKIQLPADVKPITASFQQAGYFTCIGDGLLDQAAGASKPAAGRRQGNAANRAQANRTQLGKTDYNFEWPMAEMYAGHDWSARKPGQPFFMQVQLAGGKLRGGTDESAKKLTMRAEKELGDAVKPEQVKLPPYYPASPVMLRDWAAYLDSVRLTDQHVGQVIKRLRDEGILEDTLVIFMTDHGISHARGKQFLYNEGTHVPLVVRAPRNFPTLLSKIQAGKVREDLVEHIDLAAISLAAAGLPIPPAMQARDLFAKDYQQRTEVFAARDRCDETIERLRSVRTDRFLYVRNFYPDQPHLQPNAYKDGKSIVQDLRRLHAAGELPELSERLLFQPKRPAEELYDWVNDPWQLNNLANDAQHAQTLKQLRDRLDKWILDTRDQGAEPEAMYDSDMKVYLGRGNPEVERNVASMKKWAYPKPANP
ncbi:MAG: sulfatase [Pirellulaceae bacterium]|nr:sulfatase [Pirellulaceae bacterium]